MDDRNITVEVLNPDYSARLGRVARYKSVSATWQHQGIGTATVVTPEQGALLEALNVHRVTVPITLKAPGLPRWSGRVTHARAEKVTGEPGQLQIVAVDENKLLSKLLLAPVPTAAWSAQVNAYDVRTGSLVSVARGYLQANITRLANEGYPVNMVVASYIGTDDSPTVTGRGRAHTYDERLSPMMRRHGYDTRVELWLPGDPMPPGQTTLTKPTFVVSVVKTRDQNYVKFTDTRGGVRRRTVTSSHPQAMGIVVGGPGEGQNRIFEKVMADDGRVAALGTSGYPEEWLDASGADTTAERTERARERLLELAGTSSAFIELEDGQPWRAGPDRDYWVGDKVRAEFNGVELSDRIDRVTVIDSDEQGFRVQATFGTARDTETTDVRTARRVGELVQRLRAIETGR